MQLATNLATLVTIPQVTEQHLLEASGSSSAGTHADFGQILTEQVQHEDDAKLVSSTTAATFDQAKLRSGNVLGLEQGLPSTSKVEASSLTRRIQPEMTGATLLQSAMDTPISDVQADGKTNPSNTSNRSEATGNNGTVKGKERKSEEQAAVSAPPLAADPTAAFRVPIEELPAGAAVPSLPSAEAVAGPHIATSLQLSSMNIGGNLVGETGRLELEQGESIAIGESDDAGPNLDADPNLKDIPTISPAAVLGSGVATVVPANRGPGTPAAVQMLPGAVAFDVPKDGAAERGQAEANSAAVSSTPVPSDVRAASRAESGETRTESSAGGHAVQNEHAIPVQAAVPTSLQAPLTSATNGVHAVGADGAAASSNLPHAQHGAEGSGNITANPYQRLDQSAAAPSAVFNTSANRVAVSVHDPALGWVEIKTQSTAGQVTAALVTTSGQTHEHLAGQIPSITQFLTERDVKVGSVAIEQQPTGGSNGGQAGSGDERGSNPQPGGASSGFNANSILTTVGLDADESFEERPLSYISVRA